MITAILHPGIDTEPSVRLQLPASRWDILSAKSQLGVSSLNECVFEYDTPSALPQAAKILKQIEHGPNFFDELNYFAQRTTEIVRDNLILLNGAIAIYAPEDMKNLINLTWHLDEIVMGDAGSDEELGRFLLNNGDLDFPEAMIPFLDLGQVGLDHRANHTCAFDRGLYYEDLNPGVEEVYDGITLPALPDWVFEVELANANCTDIDTALTTRLELPATQEELDETMVDLDATGIDDIQVVQCKSNISAIQDFEGADLAELDNLATLIHQMDAATYIKFLAVAEHMERNGGVYTFDGRHTINHLSQLISALDKYEFALGVRPSDVGSYGLVRYPMSDQTLLQTIELQQASDFELQLEGF